MAAIKLFTGVVHATPDQLKTIKGKIRSAMARHGHDVSDDAGQKASASRSELMRI